MRLSRVSAALVGIILAASGLPASAQELSAWFDSTPDGKAYSSIRDRAEAAAAKVRALALPDRLIADRLAEGARKRVRAERLIVAIEEEAARLETVVAVLGERSLLASKAEDRASFAAQASLLLRTGATREDLAAALDASASGPSVPGGGAGTRTADAAGKVERAFAALAAIRAVHVRFPLDEASLRALPAALVRSGLDRRQFDSLVSLFTKHRANGIPAARIASACVEALAGAASLERLERELQRRLRTP